MLVWLRFLLVSVNGYEMEKVILAYSGGLDTSVILKWLLEKGYDVVAYIADVGQDEDYNLAAEKAVQVGASDAFVEDLKDEFVKDYIFESLKGSVRYEGRYLLGTSLARPIIAKRQIEIAKKVGAKAVSHGATGKGNDQVRFELAYLALMPEVKIIAPWKDKEFLETFKGRTDLLNYAKKHGIDVGSAKKAPYSMDANLMHISYESGILEDPACPPEKEMFRLTVDPKDAPDTSTKLSVSFEKGVPIEVAVEGGETANEPLQMMNLLNKHAQANGVGRIDIVENRFVGIKSRGVYETPGATVLWAAHDDIETMTLDREVLRLKSSLMQSYAELIYNGFWFSPEMEFLQAAIDNSQEVVNGKVYLELYKGNVTVLGREAKNSLYDPELASMEVEGGYDQSDAEGFIKINAVRLQAHQLLKSRS